MLRGLWEYSNDLSKFQLRNTIRLIRQGGKNVTWEKTKQNNLLYSFKILKPRKTSVKWYKLRKRVPCR